MKKVIVLALLLAFVMPIAASQVWAADETAQAGIVDAGNKMCPMTGEPVAGKYFVTYQGKRYGLCCPGCEGMFLKDPEKYIAQMEAKEKASASTAKVTPDAAASMKMEKDMEQGSL